MYGAGASLAFFCMEIGVLVVCIFVYIFCMCSAWAYVCFLCIHTCLCGGGRKGMKTGRDEVDQGKGK